MAATSRSCSVPRAFLAAVLSFALGAGAAERSFDLALSGGSVPAERATLRVKKGDKVELRWTSDRPIVLHLHGYDLEVRVTPQAPARMAFGADIAGRFPVSEHTHGRGHHRAIVYLEVHP